MKKTDKKVKPKSKPKQKKVIKQKQKQSQSVVINISQNKSKPRARSTPAVKPSYLQTISTYPIFREETPQPPLYRNLETKPTESIFVDKATIRTEIPEEVKTTENMTSVKKSPERESKYIDIYDNLYGESARKNLDKDYDLKPELQTRLPPRKKGRPKALPLTNEEVQIRKIERNQKRNIANAIKRMKEKRDSDV